MNANIWQSAQALTEWVYDKAAEEQLHPEARGKLPHLLCVQETRLKRAKCGAAVSWAAKRGLNFT
eukprot:11060594-Lingulodinium_polyedra.AAC.1